MVNFYLDWMLDFVKALQTLYMNSEARKLLMAIYFNQKNMKKNSLLFFISLKYNLLQFELLKILIHLNIYYNVKKSTETSEFHTLLIKVKK